MPVISIYYAGFALSYWLTDYILIYQVFILEIPQFTELLSISI